MGFALSARLLEAGYDLAVYQPHKGEGRAASPHSVPRSSIGRSDLADRDIVFVMVSAPKDLEEVDGGRRRTAHGDGVSPGIVIDSSTVSTKASATIRALAAAHGSEFLASPVSGNPKVIAAGKLTLAVSGPREAFDRWKRCCSTSASGVTYVGEGEVARLVKIAHNVFLGVVIQSMAEITVLAERGGVSRDAFLAFLNDSVMGSTFTRYKTPAFVNLDFTADLHQCPAQQGHRARARRGQANSASRCRSRRRPA